MDPRNVPPPSRQLGRSAARQDYRVGKVIQRFSEAAKIRVVGIGFVAHCRSRNSSAIRLLKSGIDCGKAPFLLAANALAVKIYQLPHVGHKRLLLVWPEQPDEFAPLNSRHHRNGPTWHVGHRPVFRSKGGFGSSSLRRVIF
jgi:hypothetical protein